MKRPSKVRIGPWVWEVTYLEHKAWVRVEDPDLCGKCLPMQQQIRVRLGGDNEGSSAYSEGTVQETLLHEILHAAWHVSGLSHNHSIPEVDDREEQIVSLQSPVLYAVLRQNPELVAYLTG